MFFCPVLFAGIDTNTFFLAQSGLCFQRGSDHSVSFPQEKLDSDPYLVLNSCVWEESVDADRYVVPVPILLIFSCGLVPFSRDGSKSAFLSICFKIL